VKILFCLVEYVGGNKKFGESIEEKYWVDPLKELGHDVYIFKIDDYLYGDGLKNKDDDGLLFEYVKSINPDWIFLNDYNNLNIKDSTWKSINDLGIKTSCWFGDDNHLYEVYSRNKAKNFTHPITCDYFAVDKYLKNEYENIILSQWGTINYDLIEEVQVDCLGYDATFVGTFSHYRKFIYDYLVNEGLKVKFYGNGWDGGKVSIGEMKYIFAHSKINLNLEKIATNYDVRYLIKNPKRIARIFVNYLLKKREIHTQIKARPFEIASCKGFQISEYAMMLENYFSFHDEIKIFYNVSELAMLIKYYKDRSNERLMMSEKAYHRVMNEHLMKHRLNNVIKKVFNID